MSARQHIYRVDGTQLVVKTGAELYWKYIPGQGHYWKFRDAARFELWSLDAEGHRHKLVRTGPKVYYCLRDLKHTQPGKRSPRIRVFPGCSQDPSKRSVTLGTSVGWSDVYPSTYHQQWIDVTGLHGCFAYVHRADPEEPRLGVERGQQRLPADRPAAVGQQEELSREPDRTHRRSDARYTLATTSPSPCTRSSRRCRSTATRSAAST